MRKLTAEKDTALYSKINFCNIGIIFVCLLTSFFPIFEDDRYGRPSYSLLNLNEAPIEDIAPTAYAAIFILWLLGIVFLFTIFSKSKDVVKNKVLYKACQFGFPIDCFLVFICYYVTNEQEWIIHFGVYLILVLLAIGSILPYTPLGKTKYEALTVDQFVHDLKLDSYVESVANKKKDELKELEDSEKTEPLLGSKENLDSTKVCPVCNSPVDADAQFCPHCGNKLQ